MPGAWPSGFRIPAEVKRFPFSKTVHTGLGPIQPPSQWLSEFTRLGHEADHSPPTSAEVKNQWSYTSTSPIRLHDYYRYNFTLFLRHISFSNPYDLYLYELYEPEWPTDPLTRHSYLQTIYKLTLYTRSISKQQLGKYYMHHSSAIRVWKTHFLPVLKWRCIMLLNEIRAALNLFHDPASKYTALILNN